jgi:hypothetical protein
MSTNTPDITRPSKFVPTISPSEVAAFAAPRTARLSYHDGPLISAAQLQAIFWGPTWQQAPHSTLIGRMNEFFQFILRSSFMDVLAQYSVPGRPIGHGQYLGAVTVTTPALGDSVSDEQIRQALQGWIQDHTVAQPTANTLYFIYLPPGVVSTMDGGSSWTVYCGYHDHIEEQIYYSVQPFIDCPGCEFGDGIFDALTKVSSHELCEIITDPALNGWFDRATGDEIGDICNGNVTSLGGFVIQGEWSNNQNACTIAPRHTPRA